MGGRKEGKLERRLYRKGQREEDMKNGRAGRKEGRQ